MTAIFVQVALILLIYMREIVWLNVKMDNLETIQQEHVIFAAPFVDLALIILPQDVQHVMMVTYYKIQHANLNAILLNI